MDVTKILENLLKLHRNYANVSRAIVSRERIDNLLSEKISEEIDYSNESIREPLLEHIGHLPVIASYLYPKINRTAEINLGFAKSVDNLGPLLHDLDNEEYVTPRIRYHGFVIEEVEQDLKENFSWDHELSEMFDIIIKRYKKIRESYNN